MAEGERRFYRLWADEDAFDVDIIVKDPFGDVVTADQDNDAVPQVGFRAWISGAYTIQVIMADTYNGIGAQYWLSRE